VGKAEQCRGEFRFLAEIGMLREALRVRPTAAVCDRLARAVATQAGLDADLVSGIQDVEDRRFREAINSLQKVLAVKPDLAVALGKLGTAYAALGQNNLAAKHLRAVAASDPDDAYGYTMLGWLAYLKGDPEEALREYGKAESIEPFDAKIRYHSGLALLKLRRFGESEQAFRRALAVDPKHAGACQGLGTALRHQGRMDEAVRYARKAAQFTDFANVDILLTFADVCSDAGRYSEAEDAAAKALSAARDSSPELLPDIRRRMEEIRKRR
jgi:tetratricopeptide (TPR) repeat protein